MNLSIVIPCFNEADNVPKLGEEFFPVVAELAKTRSVEVVFVDDGSTDETWLALNNAFGNGRVPEGVTVRFERHPVNRGLGAAIRTGLTASRGEVVVTTDSDGTYKFVTIPALLACLAPDVDVVTASPYHPKGGVANVPQYRLILSQGSSMLYRLLVTWKVHTYTALYRAYRRRVIEDITFESNGFLGGTELMVKAMLRGYRVVEFPTVLYSRAFGASKAKIMRTIRAHLQFQWRVLLHRLHITPLVQPRRAEGKLQWTR
jgi:dolichol-phosphate mannosyltransferase